MPFDLPEAKRAAVAAILGVAVIFAAMWLLSRASEARPSAAFADASPEVAAWFKEQHNARGQSCCADADGEAYFGNVTFNQDGSVTLDGGLRLPAYMVLHGPNPTGHAILWHIGSTYYCFSPGALN